MLHGPLTMTEESERTRLICAIASALRDEAMTEEARAAGLTFIGWLARRMPGECSSKAGVEEMLRRVCSREAERAPANDRASLRDPTHSAK